MHLTFGGDTRLKRADSALLVQQSRLAQGILGCHLHWWREVATKVAAKSGAATLNYSNLDAAADYAAFKSGYWPDASGHPSLIQIDRRVASNLKSRPSFGGQNRLLDQA